MAKPKGIERRRDMLTSRERVNLALNHQEADRIPVDLGGSRGTGMHVSTVYRLRQALGLDKPGTPVKVFEPYQMLGEIKPNLMEALGTDVVNLTGGGVSPFFMRSMPGTIVRARCRPGEHRWVAGLARASCGCLPLGHKSGRVGCRKSATR